MAEHVVPKTKTKTVTVKGVELTVDLNLFDDLEVLELLGEMNPPNGAEPDVTALPAFLQAVLGISQYQEVKDSLRDDEGRVRIDKVAEFAQEFMSKVAPNS
ncbi:hypothetical protein CJI52_05725 [Bifidobacteriaceae bacterium WP022]|nr:hypothetical protein CJI52_05725 [Bifidobacteriaceae bacterium WP022]